MDLQEKMPAWVDTWKTKDCTCGARAGEPCRPIQYGVGTTILYHSRSEKPCDKCGALCCTPEQKLCGACTKAIPPVKLVEPETYASGEDPQLGDTVRWGHGPPEESETAIVTAVISPGIDHGFGIGAMKGALRYRRYVWLEGPLVDMQDPKPDPKLEWRVDDLVLVARAERFKPKAGRK